MYSITLKDYLCLAAILGIFMLSGIDVEGIEDTYTSATVVSGEVEHDDSLFRSDEYKAYERRNVYNYQRLEEK